MVNWFLKKCPLSLFIREMQIKTKWDITSHLMEWLLSKWQKVSADKDVEKMEPLHTVGGNAK
jgi:hypothetical protein